MSGGFTGGNGGYVLPMRPDVELRLPVDSAYVSVIRATTVSLAARLDFTLDDIEDLRMAVGEACAVALPEADEDADLVCRYYLSPGRIRVSVQVSSSDAAPDTEGFAWQMLKALTTSATVDAAEGFLTVDLTLSSSADL